MTYLVIYIIGYLLFVLLTIHYKESYQDSSKIFIGSIFWPIFVLVLLIKIFIEWIT